MDMDENHRDAYRQLFSSIKDAIVLADFNSEQILDVNHAALHLYGYSRKELLKMCLSDLTGKHEHPGSGKKTIHRHKKKDGSFFPIESTYDVFNTSEGKIVYVIIRDIADRIRMEEALVESEEKYLELYKNAKKTEELYRSLIHSSADALIIFDMKWRASYVSPAFTRLFGWTLKDITHNEASFFKESEIEQAVSYIKALIDNGTPCHNLETKQYTKERHPVEVSISASQFNDGEGAPSGILTVIRDISVRKQLEAQLMHAERMESIGTLAGGIAHDFNNILASVIGYTELAMDDAKQETLLYSNLQEVLIAGNRAKELVDQILTFSSQAEHELEPVQLKAMIHESLKLLRASLPSTIKIELNIQSDAQIMADPSQLSQIIFNLCTNAGHAMQKKGGVLTIGLVDVELGADIAVRNSDMPPGPYLKLSVSDTGHGMTTSVLSRAFNPFFTTKPQGKGTGMGLSMVHGIVSSLGGLILPYSEPKKGSVFNIYLPVIKGIANDVKITKALLPKGRGRILLVDDEAAIVKMSKQLIERLGYDVEARTGSIQALELFKSMPDAFDLIITDMTMPDMTGTDLAKEILLLRPGIPIILCTGFGKTISKDNAEAIGITAVVAKPILSHEIAEIIKTVINK